MSVYSKYWLLLCPIRIHAGLGFVLLTAFNFQIQDKTFLVSGEIVKEGDSFYLRSSVDGTVCKSKVVILDNTIYLFFPVKFLSLLPKA